MPADGTAAGGGWVWSAADQKAQIAEPNILHYLVAINDRVCYYDDMSVHRLPPTGSRPHMRRASLTIMAAEMRHSGPGYSQETENAGTSPPPSRERCTLPEAL
jgi:hypothetical protein